MKVRVNGAQRELPEGASVSDLLAALNLRSGAVVELNLHVVRPDLFDETKLNDDDTIEIVRFVGGG